MQELEDRLRDALAAYPSAVIVSPLGARTGTHVDHIVTRDVCASLFPDRVIYSLDYPYSRWQHPWLSVDHSFLHNQELVPALFAGSQDVRSAAMSCYASQLPLLFPNGALPTTIPAEVYYLNTRVVDQLSSS